MHFEIFDRDDPIFSREKVNKYILIIRKGKNSDEAKLELYKMMKKVITRNVNNYVKFFRNSVVSDKSLEEDELYGESFIIMMKCVEGFKVKKNNCFYFYFSKSLSRTFFRMLEKEKRKLEGSIKYRSKADNDITNLDLFSNTVYGLDLVLSGLDLDSFDKKVLNSKLLFQKKDDFIVSTRGATVSKYYASIRKIKFQIQKLKENGDL